MRVTVCTEHHWLDGSLRRVGDPVDCYPELAHHLAALGLVTLPDETPAERREVTPSAPPAPRSKRRGRGRL